LEKHRGSVLNTKKTVTFFIDSIPVAKQASFFR